MKNCQDIIITILKLYTNKLLINENTVKGLKMKTNQKSHVFTRAFLFDSNCTAYHTHPTGIGYSGVRQLSWNCFRYLN